MSDSLDIFYNEDWIDADRITLMDAYRDFYDIIDGVNRHVRRHFDGYKIFINDTYSCTYYRTIDVPVKINKDHMHYDTYLILVGMIADKLDIDINEIVYNLVYKHDD